MSLLTYLCGHHCGTVDNGPGATVVPKHCAHCHGEKLAAGIGTINDHRRATGITSPSPTPQEGS
jgi:hypothetical protein